MKNPPQDTIAERSLIATLAMCRPSDARLLIPRLSQDCFMHPNYRAMFKALSGLIASGASTDATSIWTEIQRLGLAIGVDFPFVVETVQYGDEVSTPSVLVDLLNQLRHRRELIRMAEATAMSAYDLTTDPGEIIQVAQDELHRVTLDGRKDEGEGWEEILHSMAAHERFRDAGPDSMGRWGIPTLDHVAPIPAGEFVSIGARPGVGKTAFMSQIAVESARAGIKTLVITLELPLKSMRARIASYIAEIPVQELKKGNYDHRHTMAVGNVPNITANGRTQAPTPGTSWSKLDAMIRYEVDRHGIQLVLLDQFDKIGRPEVGRGSTEAYAFGKVSIGIMALAKELGIGFVLLCQLKGDAEGREPTLADHADSDRPGKDAGIVVHLWRDKDGNTKAKIQKNRDGAYVGRRLELDFNGACQRFTEVERETEEYQTNHPIFRG